MEEIIITVASHPAGGKSAIAQEIAEVLRRHGLEVTFVDAPFGKDDGDTPSPFNNARLNAIVRDKRKVLIQTVSLPRLSQAGGRSS